MSEDFDPTDVPQAVPVPKKKMRLSVVWIIPLLAALVAVGLAIQNYLSKGPEITIIFKEAQGLEPDKTFIKYKEIEIGRVKEVKLSPDFSRIEVKAEIEKSAAGLVVEDTKFWVVKTQVSLSGVSGLGTLLSGNYIGIDPGKSKKKAKDFEGLDVAPVVTGGQPGREFLLQAETLGALGVGSPVYYRSLNAGQVTAYSLAPDGKTFDIKVFVNAPYDRYVTPQTRFWNASGIDVSMGASGLQVKTTSLLSVLIGGVSFEQPPGASAGEPAAPQSLFTLHPDRSSAFAQVETEFQRYVAYFTGSLKGLVVGAPVNFLGLKVGEVTDAGLELDPTTFGLRPRVVLAVYPNRLMTYVLKKTAERPQTVEARRAFVQRLVDRGLRAELQMGSFVSGQLLVSLDYHPHAPKYKMDWSKDPPELPTARGALQDFEEKLTTILTKVEKLPLDDIGRDTKKLLASLDQTAQGANRVVTKVDQEVMPDVKKTLANLERTLQSADKTMQGAEKVMARVDSETLPDVKKTLGSLDGTLKSADQTMQGAGKVMTQVDGETLPALRRTLEELQRSVVTVQQVLANTDSVLNPDGAAQQDLRDALMEFSRASRSIRLITDNLERHPEALIRGKPQQEKP